MTSDEWQRVLIDTAAEDAEAVDEVLEAVGYLRVTYAGEEWHASIACRNEADLILVRLACPPGLVGKRHKEDLSLPLLDAEDVGLAREILRDIPAVCGEVRVRRGLGIDVRDAETLVAIRVGLAARLAPGVASIEIL